MCSGGAIWWMPTRWRLGLPDWTVTCECAKLCELFVPSGSVSWVPVADIQFRPSTLHECWTSCRGHNAVGSQSSGADDGETRWWDYVITAAHVHWLYRPSCSLWLWDTLSHLKSHSFKTELWNFASLRQKVKNGRES